MTDSTVTTITTTRGKPGAFFLIVVGLAMIVGSFAFPIGVDVPYSPTTPWLTTITSLSRMHYAELLNMTGVGAFIGGCVLSVGGQTVRVSPTPLADGGAAGHTGPTGDKGGRAKLVIAVATSLAILLVAAYHFRQTRYEIASERASPTAADEAAATDAAARAAAAVRATNAIRVNEMAEAEATREAFQREARAKLNAPPELVSPDPDRSAVVSPPRHTPFDIR